MSLAKVPPAVMNHLLNPLTFKTADNKPEKIIKTVVDRVMVIAVAIISAGLAIVGGALIFYTYTAALKAVRMRQIAHGGGSPSPIPPKPPTPPKATMTLKQITDFVSLYIPLVEKQCKSIEPLKTKMEGLTSQCRQALDNHTKRLTLLQLGEQFTNFKRNINDIKHQVKGFLDKKLGALEIQNKMGDVKEEIVPYLDLCKEMESNLESFIYSLPLNHSNLEEEIKLLRPLSTSKQRRRFEQLLESQFKRHNIRGDGACGVRSLVNGIWPNVLKMRETDPVKAESEENRLALQLRQEVADYMVENVQNVIHNRLNKDGSKPQDFRDTCNEIPAPEGVGEGTSVTFDEYIAEIRKPHTFFGNQEMMTAAKLYNIQVQIYKAGSVDVVSNRFTPKDDFIYGDRKLPNIAYLYHDGGHYEIMTRV